MSLRHRYYKEIITVNHTFVKWSLAEKSALFNFIFSPFIEQKNITAEQLFTIDKECGILYNYIVAARAQERN